MSAIALFALLGYLTSNALLLSRLCALRRERDVWRQRARAAGAPLAMAESERAWGEDR